jgi:hypothetical protein
MPIINDAHTIIFQDSKGSDILGDEFGLLRASMDRNARLLDDYIRDQRRRESDSLVRQTTPRDERSRPDEMRQMASMMSRGVQHVHLENAMGDIVYPLYERMLAIADESSTRQERYDREHFFYYNRMLEALDGINEHNEDVSRGLILTFHYMRNHPIMATGKAFVSLIKGAAGLVKTAGNVIFGQGDQRTIQQKQLDVQKRTLHFIRTGEAKARSRSPLSILKEEGVAGSIAGVFAKQLAQDRENKRAAGEEVGSGFLGLGSRADASQSEFITLLGRSGKVGGTGEHYPKMIEQLDEANKKLFSIVYFMTEQHPELLEDFKVRESALIEMGNEADKDGVWRAKSVGKFNAIESFLKKLTVINEDQLNVQDNIGDNTRRTLKETIKIKRQAWWIAIKGGITSLLSSPAVIAGLVAAYIWKRIKDDKPLIPSFGLGGDNKSSTGLNAAGEVGILAALATAAKVATGASFTGVGIAAIAGWLIGNQWLGPIIRDSIDEGIDKLTGGKSETLGDAIYSFVHPNEDKGDHRSLSQIPYSELGFDDMSDVPKWLYKPYFDLAARLSVLRKSFFGRVTEQSEEANQDLQKLTEAEGALLDSNIGLWTRLKMAFTDRQTITTDAIRSVEVLKDEFVLHDEQVEWATRIMRSSVPFFKHIKTEASAVSDGINNEMEGVWGHFDSIAGASQQVTRSWNDRFQQFRKITAAGWNARSDALNQWGTDWISSFDQNKETVNTHIGRVTQIMQSVIPFFRQNKTETSNISDEINNEMEDSMGRLETAFSSITGFFGGIRDRIRGLIKGDVVDDVVPSMTDENLDSVISRMSQLPISPMTSIGNQSRQQMPISSITSEESRSFAPVERSSVFKNPDAVQGNESLFDPDRFKDPELARLLKSIDGHLNTMSKNRLEMIPFGNEPDAVMTMTLMGE